MSSYPALDLRFAPGPGAGALQDLLYAELDAFEPLAIHDHEAGDGWRVFFKTHAQRQAAAAALASALGGQVLGVTQIDVEDEDWARRSQAALTSIRVGRITVAPPWDVPSMAPDDILIVIDPSMGFGTGHHATTRLCLEMLQQVDLRGTRVIDVGTGSGVLAIAAAKLGAASVVAIDNDPDALQNARENIARNAVTIDVREGDLSVMSEGPADVVTANLTGAVLQKFADELALHVSPGGTLIVSGFSPDELPDIVRAFRLAVAQDQREGEWAAVRLERPGRNGQP